MSHNFLIAIFCSGILLSSLMARAQESPVMGPPETGAQVAPTPDSEIDRLKLELEGAGVSILTGETILIAGMVETAVGVVLIGVKRNQGQNGGYDDGESSFSYYGPDEEDIIHGAVLFGGLAAGATGLVTYIVGKGLSAKYERKLKSLQPKQQLAFQGVSLLSGENQSFGLNASFKF